MKDRLFMLAAVLFAALFPPVSWSVQNSWVGSPIGSSTVPQSSIRNGLVNTPDPIDTAGNLLITGNVRRGMHFRGSVPYQSPTSFGSTLGSSALSSFLRDAAGPEDFGSYAQGYGPQPYYSATETVTTMAPGRSEILSPMTARMNARVQQDARLEGTAAFGLEALSAEPMSFTRGTATESAVAGPRTRYHLFEESRLTAEDGFSLGYRSPERLGPGWAGTNREGEMSAVQHFQDQGQDTTDRMQTAAADSGLGLGYGVSSPEWRQRQPGLDTSLQYQDPQTSIEPLRSRLETQVPAEQSAAGARQTVTAGYGSSSLNELAPSISRTSQGGSVLQNGTSRRLVSNQYEDSVKGETVNVGRSAQYTSIPQSGVSAEGLTDQNQRDVLERIRQQLQDLTKSVDASLQNAPDEPGQTVKTTAVTKPEALRLSGHGYLFDLPGTSRQRLIGSRGESNLYKSARAASGLGKEFPGTTGLVPAQNETSALGQFKPLSPTEIGTEAKQIMGPHTSLDSLSSAKFNEHVRAAEGHLRAGRYYRAADSFALASAYKPDDPLVLAGQSHALFAAGEYMSSALFLSRTLAIYPEYVQMRVDLVELLGGQEKLAHRLADVEQWYARSGSGQLQLLLSYVYYRTGNLPQARRAVNGAYEEMPELPAVRAMKTAIDGVTR